MDPTRAERIAERQALTLMEALGLVREAVAAGMPADSCLSEFHRNHHEFGSRDRRLFSSVIFAYFRWKGWLDLLTDRPNVACVFAHLLEADELHPAVRKLATRAGMAEPLPDPMGSLTLPEKAEALERYAGHPFSLAQLVPVWVPALLGPDSDRLIASFQSPPPTWLRTDPARRAEIVRALLEHGERPDPHAVVRSAIAVPRGINLRAIPHPTRDRLDIQDLASQAVGLICAPKPGQNWWDACCGSGGKTIHLAELGGPSLRLLASDIRPSMLQGLTRRLEEARLRFVETAVWDGTTEPPPGEHFDGILLDAPCSGTGTWHRNPDARQRTSREAVESLVGLQCKLLSTCAGRLKPGGVLVYATCSVTTVENEDLIAAFLAANPGFAPTPFLNPLTGQDCPGLLRINPWDGPCNGMFIAKILLKPY